MENNTNAGGLLNFRFHEGKPRPNLLRSFVETCSYSGGLMMKDRGATSEAIKRVLAVNEGAEYWRMVIKDNQFVCSPVGEAGRLDREALDLIKGSAMILAPQMGQVLSNILQEPNFRGEIPLDFQLPDLGVKGVNQVGLSRGDFYEQNMIPGVTVLARVTQVTPSEMHIAVEGDMMTSMGHATGMQANLMRNPDGLWVFETKPNLL